jgi:hypothetical protein
MGMALTPRIVALRMDDETPLFAFNAEYFKMRQRTTGFETKVGSSSDGCAYYGSKGYPEYREQQRSGIEPTELEALDAAILVALAQEGLRRKPEDEVILVSTHGPAF